MSPGPKPKKNTAKRQVLGVAVKPETNEALDRLIDLFSGLDPYLPSWFGRPETKSSAAAWILERYIEAELYKIGKIVEEHRLGLEEIQSGFKSMNDDDGVPVSLTEEVTDLVVGDPFLDSLRNQLTDYVFRRQPPIRKE